MPLSISFKVLLSVKSQPHRSLIWPSHLLSFFIHHAGFYLTLCRLLAKVAFVIVVIVVIVIAVVAHHFFLHHFLHFLLQSTWGNLLLFFLLWSRGAPHLHGDRRKNYTLLLRQSVKSLAPLTLLCVVCAQTHWMCLKHHSSGWCDGANRVQQPAWVGVYTCVCVCKRIWAPGC